MGTLKPGATYIYERVDDVIYAREAGTTVRREIGRDYNRVKRVEEEALWKDILCVAKEHPTLQEALDHAIMIYKLCKEYEDGI